ncbi:hypothetical protein [Hymenobacter daeguensis]
MKAYFASAFLLAGITISSFKPQEKQSFEGTIVYRIDAQSKTPNISTENLQKLYGKQMALSIQGNKYRMSYSGLDLKEVFYLGSTNKQYALRNDIDTLFITNCTEEKRQLVSSTITTGTAVILSHKCRLLTNNLGTTQNQYWFDSSIYIDPSNFKNHKFGYFNVYYEKAKSPYLKYVYNGANFSLTYTAISIQEKKLSSNVFQLPKLPQKGF